MFITLPTSKYVIRISNPNTNIEYRVDNYLPVINNNQLLCHLHCKDISNFNTIYGTLNNLNLKQVDKDTVFFIAVHGLGGEDGQVQDLLSKNGYRFTGSDYESTKKCWDKVLSKEILIQNNINTPKFKTIDKNENLKLNLTQELSCMSYSVSNKISM